MKSRLRIPNDFAMYSENSILYNLTGEIPAIKPEDVISHQKKIVKVDVILKDKKVF